MRIEINDKTYVNTINLFINGQLRQCFRREKFFTRKLLRYTHDNTHNNKTSIIIMLIE